MDQEEISTERPNKHWYISLDWFQQNNRSISALVQSCLCPKCTERLSAVVKGSSQDTLMATVRDCCSHAPDFITDQSPILESVFRIFLANGNHPLTLEELGKQLGELRGGDTYRTALTTLLHLLKNEQYYGLQEVKE